MKTGSFLRDLARRLVMGTFVCAIAPARAQTQNAPLEVAVTYNTMRSLQAGANQSFWQQGGSAELSGSLWKSVAIVADVTGTHSDSISSTGVPLSLVTTTFGPRYRFAAAHKVSPYGQALIGIANGFDSVFPSPGGAQNSYTSMALQISGGVDVRLSKHLAVRVLDAGWLRTQLPNATANVQNNLRLGAGLVFRTSR
jgi:opacity protein-like surface antigen